MNMTGGCLCRAISFAAEGPPKTVHYCHCSMCRRATGGPVAVLAWFGRDRLRWQGEPPRLYRSSPVARRGFCARCGTPLLLHYDGSDEIAVMIGALDQPERCLPDHHYGVEGRLAWFDCGKGLPEQPTQKHLAAVVAG